MRCFISESTGFSFFFILILSLSLIILIKKKKAGIISLLDEEEPQLKVNGVLRGNLVGSNVRNNNINQRLFRFAPEGIV